MENLIENAMLPSNPNNGILTLHDLIKQYPSHWLYSLVQLNRLKHEDNGAPLVSHFMVLDEHTNPELQRYLAMNNPSFGSIYTGICKNVYDWYRELEDDDKDMIPVHKVILTPIIQELVDN